MSGDIVETLAAISSSVSSHTPIPAPDLDSNVDTKENGVKSDGDICVNGDRGTCGNSEIEMEGQDVVMNGKGDDTAVEAGSNEELVVGIDGSSDDISASGKNVTNGNGIGTTENGKASDEIGQSGGVAGAEGEKDKIIDAGGKEVDEEEKEDEDEDGDDAGKEHEFYVGKYVWGKIRNNPWWPGQIYDPSDASDYAKKLQTSKRLLVAYFGDGSFSWCSLSQLKPFAENFENLSKQNTSRKFTCAVEAALKEIGRLVESKMSWPYISEENRSALSRPVAVNAGIRQGVLVPEYGLSEIPQLEPAEIVSLLRDIATKASFSCKLGLTVLNSWLSAFYRSNGKNALAVFYEPQDIEGLEDKGRDVLVDVIGSVLEPKGGPSDDDLTSMPTQNEFGEPNQHWLHECEGVEADKLHKRRKRKSVAELMKEEEVVEPGIEKGNMESDLKSGKRKTRLPSEEEVPSQSVHEINSILGSKRGRRKSENIKSLEEVLSAERGGTEDNETEEKDQVSPVETDDREELVLTNGKKKKNELASLKQCGNKLLSAKNGDGEDQLVSEKKNKEYFNRKVGKITIKETENVAVSMEKGEYESSDKDSKGKSVDQARRDLDPPLLKMTRKRKKNEISDEITEKEESSKNRSKNKVTSIEDEKREETENVSVEEKEYVTEKVDKIFQGNTENVAASGEKRAARSSVKGLKGKSGDENPNNGGEYPSSPLKRNARKRKQAENLDSPEIMDIKEKAKIGRKDNMIGTDNDNQEETEIIRASRERKKSMYLSPPFINFNSISRSLSPKTARMGERMTRLASEVIGSTPTLNRSNEPLLDNISKEDDNSAVVSQNPSPPPSKEGKKTIHEGVTRVADQILRSSSPVNSSDRPLQDNLANKGVTSVNTYLKASPQSSEEDEKKIIESVRIIVSLKEVVYEVRSAAINPLTLWDKTFLDKVVGFIFAYRNVNYLHGSYYKIYHNARQGEKLKSMKTRANYKDPGEEVSKPVSLLVIFPPGFRLPLKTDLVAIFSKFGSVNEMETAVSDESYCAKVVFSSCSDTEKAFDTCLKENPFGSAKVSYRLQYSAGSSKAEEILEQRNKLWASAEFEGSCLLFIKQKLEIMTSMVDKCGGNMSTELMAKLENEMKGLLDNISTISKSGSA